MRVPPTPLRLAALAALLAVVFSLLAPPFAQAADYGFWFPAPGKGNTSAYQVNVGAFNSQELEISSFACVLDDGTVLREHEQEILKNTFMYAGLVYVGEFSFGKVHDDVDESKVSKNGAYPSGRKGMQMFLRDMVALIRVNTWAPKDHWEVVKADFDDGGGTFGFVDDAKDWVVDKVKDGARTFIKEGSKVALWSPLYGGEVGGAVGDAVADFVVPEEEDDGTWLLQKWWRPGGNSDLAVRVSEEAAKPFRIEAARVSKIAGLINTDAANPLALYALQTEDGKRRVSATCDLGGYTPPDALSFSDLISNPDGAIAQIVFGLPARLGGALWNFSFGPAVKYSFWTPHTERGDTLFNITDNCDPKQVNASKRAAQCDGRKALGFDKRRVNPDKQPGWLSVREFFQWLVSGTYFIIMFTAAIVFMIRGTASQTWNVMRLMPRLILSILFTVFSAFLIGAVVSTSNLLIQALFDFRQQGSLALLNGVIQQAWMASGVGESLRSIVDAIVVLPMGIFAIGLAALGVIRQLILLLLVLSAPIAGFCLIIEKWRHWFNRWWAMLLVVCGLPVVMAGLFKLSLIVNPLLANPDGSYGTPLGFLGVMLIVITMWFLLVLARRTIGAALNSRVVSGSLSGQVAGQLGRVLGHMPHPALRAVGAAARGYSSASGALDKLGGKLVPQDRILAATAGAGVASRGLGAKSPLDGLVGRSAALGGKTAGGYRWLQDYMARRSLGGNGRELSGEEVAKYTSLAQQYAGKTPEEWDRLTPDEKAGYIRQVAGFERVRATRDGRFFVDEGDAIREARRQNALAAAQQLATGEAAAAAAAGNAWRSARAPYVREDQAAALQEAQRRLQEEPLRPDGKPATPQVELPPDVKWRMEQEEARQAAERLEQEPLRPDGKEGHDARGAGAEDEARRASRLNRYRSEAGETDPRKTVSP